MCAKSLNRSDIIKKRGFAAHVEGDGFSLSISTPAVIAHYLRERIGNPDLVLAELCCGVGCTLSVMAPAFKSVIGVDYDAQALDFCKKNFCNSSSSEKAAFILGDISDLRVLQNINADIVIYDIPYWHSHSEQNKGDLKLKNPDLRRVVQNIQKTITTSIIIFAPPTFEYESALKLFGRLEWQQVFLDDLHDRNIVYLGDLAFTPGKTDIKLYTS